VESTKLSAKGQVVIPHRVRKQLGWQPGTCLVVETTDGGITLRPVLSLDPTTVDDVYGCLHYRGPRRSLQDMDDAIRRGAQTRK
jgi:AbrB family looped-hinge helix DNA binding protein